MKQHRSPSVPGDRGIRRGARALIPALVLGALSLFGAEPLAAQLGCPAPGPVVGDAEQPAAAIRYLADDALHGRMAGTAHAACAARYIAAEMERIGLEPAGDGGTYFQELPVASAINPHAPGGTGRNVIGLLPGADPSLADEALVIGAHFDHLGLGGFGSLEPDVRAIHNGADDNASGVGAMLAVAERLAAGPRPDRSIVFVAFTGEEFGLLGSAYYTEHPAVSLDATVAMLNMDMVGRLGDAALIVYGVDTAEEWGGVVREAAEAASLEIAEHGDGYGPSDHTSFYGKGVPVLHFFTNVHGDYHKPSDDWQKIDLDGVRRVVDMVTRVSRAVAAGPRITHLAGAGTPPDEQASGGYGAYLGSIPDFTPVERGVRLSGVSAESPAEAAGLRGGDIIVGFDEDEVGDLYDMTEALRARAPGDTTVIHFLRDGERRRVEVVLGRRGSDER